MRNRRLPAGRTGHGEGFCRPPRCLSYRIVPDQCGPGRRDAGPGRVQLAADRVEMAAELIPVLLQPLLRAELRWPPRALELIKLILGFREATPELAYLAFQPVALLVQLTEAGGRPVGNPGQFPRRSGFRRALDDALTIAAKPGHWPTLMPYRPLTGLPRRRTQPEGDLPDSSQHASSDPVANPPVPASAAVWRSVRSHGDTKTAISRRTLALPEMAVNALWARRERQPANGPPPA